MPEQSYHRDAALELLAKILQEKRSMQLGGGSKLDRYLAASQLQKAIRRDKPDLAWQAAAFLIENHQQYFWKCLAVIALEDVGIGDLPVVHAALLASADPGLRTKLGGSVATAAGLVGALCGASKDRSADDLYDVLSRDMDVLDERARLGWGLPVV